jgi:hypothetical protein
VFQDNNNNKLRGNHLLPEDQRFERCKLASSSDTQENGFQIGKHCTPINKICGMPPREIDHKPPEDEWIYHPQRFSICQNWTFWNERKTQSKHRVMSILLFMKKVVPMHQNKI